MSDSESARRCTMCAIDWPDNYTLYSKCLECGEKTDRISNGNPMASAEAKSRKSWLDFERFYEKRCSERESREIAELESILQTPSASDGPPAVAS